MIFGRQPAAWIGLIVTLVGVIVSTLLGQGFISEVTAGKVTDVVQAFAQFVLAILPLIAGLLIKGQVTPVVAPVLPKGTRVRTPGQDPQDPPAAVVSGAAPIR